MNFDAKENKIVVLWIVELDKNGIPNEHPSIS
jgi:hypothetical protein